MRNSTSLVFLSSFFCLFLCAAMAQQEAVISSKSSLSLRSAPSKTSNKIDSIASGAKVEIIEKTSSKEIIEDKENYWYKIRFSGKEGYVFGGFLNIIANDKTAKEFSYKDFQGTWEEQSDEGSLFISITDEEKFVATSGEAARKISAKVKEFTPEDSSLVLTLEDYDEGEEEPTFIDGG